jgi:hypothetical protein
VRFAGDYGPSTRNTLYVASERLSFPGLDREVAGGGVFGPMNPHLQLTEAGGSRSTWRVPVCFHPREGVAPLSYHSDARRWTRDGDHTVLRSVARGQEFVLDCGDYPEVPRWLVEIFAAAPHADRHGRSR